MIKRYRSTLTAHNGFASIGMVESPNGDCVLYTDHRAECERLVRKAIELTHGLCVCGGVDRLVDEDEGIDHISRIVREVMEGGK